MTDRALLARAIEALEVAILALTSRLAINQLSDDEIAEIRSVRDDLIARRDQPAPSSGVFVLEADEFDRIVADLQNPRPPTESIKRGAELLRQLDAIRGQPAPESEGPATRAKNARVQTDTPPQPASAPAGAMEPWEKEAALKQRECRHEDLFFGSGGFYVFCRQCSAAWVAKLAGGADTRIDYDRSAALVCTADNRVPPRSAPPVTEDMVERALKRVQPSDEFDLCNNGGDFGFNRPATEFWMRGAPTIKFDTVGSAKEFAIYQRMLAALTAALPPGGKIG